MIAIAKLRSLPRRLRLRKIANLLYFIETIAETETETYPDSYLAELFGLLDEEPAITAAVSSRDVTWSRQLAATSRADRSAFRRLLNSLRYAIYGEIGQQLADWDFVDKGGKLDAARRLAAPGMRVYLEDLRSPFNVGSIFRSAEAFGVERIAISPLCASPEHPRARRSAMGCVDVVDWERKTGIDPEEPCFALETGGIALGTFRFPPRGFMVVGGEELGVSPEALAVADVSFGRVTIPQWGAKGSLNVAVAVGIVLHAWAESRFNASVGSPA